MHNLNSRNDYNVLKGLVTKTRKTNEMAAEWQS